MNFSTAMQYTSILTLTCAAPYLLSNPNPNSNFNTNSNTNNTQNAKVMLLLKLSTCVISFILLNSISEHDQDVDATESNLIRISTIANASLFILTVLQSILRVSSLRSIGILRFDNYTKCIPLSFTSLLISMLFNIDDVIGFSAVNVMLVIMTYCLILFVSLKDFSASVKEKEENGGLPTTVGGVFGVIDNSNDLENLITKRYSLFDYFSHYITNNTNDKNSTTKQPSNAQNSSLSEDTDSAKSTLDDFMRENNIKRSDLRLFRIETLLTLGISLDASIGIMNQIHDLSYANGAEIEEGKGNGGGASGSDRMANYQNKQYNRLEAYNYNDNTDDNDNKTSNANDNGMLKPYYDDNQGDEDEEDEGEKNTKLFSLLKEKFPHFDLPKPKTINKSILKGSRGGKSGGVSFDNVNNGDSSGMRMSKLAYANINDDGDGDDNGIELNQQHPTVNNNISIATTNELDGMPDELKAIALRNPMLLQKAIEISRMNATQQAASIPASNPDSKSGMETAKKKTSLFTTIQKNNIKKNPEFKSKRLGAEVAFDLDSGNSGGISGGGGGGGGGDSGLMSSDDEGDDESDGDENQKMIWPSNMY